MNRMPGHSCTTKTRRKALLGTQHTARNSQNEKHATTTDLWLLSYDLGRPEALLSGFGYRKVYRGGHVMQ